MDSLVDVYALVPVHVRKAGSRACMGRLRSRTRVWRRGVCTFFGAAEGIEPWKWWTMKTCVSESSSLIKREMSAAVTLASIGEELSLEIVSHSQAWN